MKCLLFAIYTLLVFTSCSMREQKNEIPASPPATPESLAKTYCGSCHQYPEPSLLDHATWKKYVLPRMGYMYGIYPHDSVRKELVGLGKDAEIIEEAGVFPRQQRLADSTWKSIVDYYLSHAPDSLPQPATKKISMDLELFEVVETPYRLSPPGTTCVAFGDDGLYLGDAHTQKIYHFDSRLQLQQAARTKEGAVWINNKKESLLITVMGSFSPTDEPSGFLMELPKNKEKKAGKIISGLRRPVHTALGDLNGDDLEDMVICEFAKWTGRLTWWEQTPAGKYKMHLLSGRPGAIKAYIKDLNQDGLPDVIALFGQGDEGIFAYYNQGNGNFTEETMIRFPPSYGSSYFNWVDFNGDGLEDIIYTAGDNADYLPLMKPYHGIRIYENDGSNRFSESFFFHQNGAYNAIPFDFDQDGDIDIASISFFPDYEKTPEESFVYLENDGHGNFKAATFKHASRGRWIVMDHADWDGDGDEDLVLGALAFEVIPDHLGYVKKWTESGLSFVILENTLK
ncbi:VCBS repeat-containing protein [Fulvivirgaceae bacterium BMA12]|uniref:VCBS repeat-containing protein n=1 Tax=Agaribacillus aureus TaxID=3051825 RepID=A0ABT8LGQ8_9BACT|nr:VCBS repeat-containing protein [Fulvivirgaceae bacterium BMA12]